MASADALSSDSKYDREAAFFQAFAHPARLMLLDLIEAGPRCACEILPDVDLDQSTVSRHLSTLRRAGVLKARKDGVRVLYEISDPRIFELRRLAQEVLRARTEEDFRLFTGTPPTALRTEAGAEANARAQTKARGGTR